LSRVTDAGLPSSAEHELEAALGLAWLSRWGCSPLLALLRDMPLVRVWRAGARELGEWGFTPKAIARFMDRRRTFSCDRFSALLEREGIGFVRYGCALYPAELYHLEHPPAGLFHRGEASLLPLLGSVPRVAIVGTRKASAYGRNVTETFARAFVQAGVAVISGMAYGVDGRAHEATLEVGGLTVAVLGCGVDVVYPPRHRRLYERIVDRGLVLSELPPGCPPSQWSFPHRNRLLAALGDAVLMVEGSMRSGAVQTVDWGLRLGRSIFAVPGPIMMESHMGCNSVIRDGARPALDPDVVVEEFLLETGIERGARVPRTPALPGVHAHAGPAVAVDGRVSGAAGMTSEAAGPTIEAVVLHALAAGPCSADALIVETGRQAREVAAALGLLELAGAVRRVGPGLFIRAP